MSDFFENLKNIKKAGYEWREEMERISNDIYTLTGYSIERIRDLFAQGYELRPPQKPSGESIKELMEISASLQKENNQLKNRCFALTRGTICLFCPMECEHRTEDFRTDL